MSGLPSPQPSPKMGEGDQGKRLLLIDGNAILHRAYHAYPGFTDKEGNPTNAIYGFFAMLLKLLEDVKPEYLAICFDRGAPTFKMNMYAGYHENRPKMQDDLASQVPRLHGAIDNIGVPHFGLDGFEADDLLGTLASQATGEGIETIIVTGDRDLLQLVNEKVKILMPLVGITKTMLFDEDRVEEKYGVRPDQFIDYKALVGDASDNYPGVTGIGPKTAAHLLQKYGTFEGLYRHLGEMNPQVANRLATDAEQAALAKQLATIITDAPIHLKLKDCVVADFDKEKFEKVFDGLGFESLKKRLFNQGEGERVKGKEEKGSKVVKKIDPQSVSAQLELL